MLFVTLNAAPAIAMRVNQAGGRWFLISIVAILNTKSSIVEDTTIVAVVFIAYFGAQVEDRVPEPEWTDQI